MTLHDTADEGPEGTLPGGGSLNIGVLDLGNTCLASAASRDSLVLLPSFTFSYNVEFPQLGEVEKPCLR
jgi:hypothetical protein